MPCLSVCCTLSINLYIYTLHTIVIGYTHVHTYTHSTYDLQWAHLAKTSDKYACFMRNPLTHDRQFALSGVTFSAN